MPYESGDILDVTNNRTGLRCIVEVIEIANDDDGKYSYNCYILQIIRNGKDFIKNVHIKPNDIEDIDKSIHEQWFGACENDSLRYNKKYNDFRTNFGKLINKIYVREKRKEV